MVLQIHVCLVGKQVHCAIHIHTQRHRKRFCLRTLQRQIIVKIMQRGHLLTLRMQQIFLVGNQRCAVHKTALLGAQLFAVQNQLAEIPQELAFQLDRITFIAVIFRNIHRIDMRFARCRDFNHLAAKSLDQPRIFIFRVDDDQIILWPAQHDTCHHLHNSKGFAEAGHAQHHTSRGRQQFSVDHNQIFTAGVGALIQSTGLEQFLRSKRHIDSGIHCQESALQRQPFLSKW